jgi:hypothetical protein
MIDGGNDSGRIGSSQDLDVIRDIPVCTVRKFCTFYFTFLLGGQALVFWPVEVFKIL